MAMIRRGQFNSTPNNTSNRILTSLSTPAPLEYKPISGRRSTITDYSSYYKPPKREEPVNPLIPTNNPQKAVDNSIARLEAGGFEVPERKNTSLGNVLMTVLDVMQRPQYMVTNILSELTDGEQDSAGDILKAGWQGLTGERKSSTTDILDNYGWKNDENKKWYQGGNLARNIIGFLGDVALDPTTYVSFGSLKASKLAKEGLEEVVKKGSKDSIETVAERIADIFTKADVIAAKEAGRKAVVTTAADVLGKVAKHGDQSEMVLRIADALSTNPIYTGLDDFGKAAVNEMYNPERVATIIDKGLDYVNKDMLSDFVNRGNKAISGITDDLLEGQNSLRAKRNQSLASYFPELSKGDYNVGDLLSNPDTFKEGQNIIEELADVFRKRPINSNVFDRKTYKWFSDEEKIELLKKVYSGKNVNGAVFNIDDFKYMSQDEFNILEILVNHFGVDKATPLVDTAEKIRSAMMRTGSATDLYRDPASLLSKIKASGRMEDTLRGTIKKIEGGVEFANGLQRVYDDISKKFMFRYDNPFTGTVKPIANLSPVLDPIKEKALNVITDNKPLRTVADAIGWLFEPEHVSLRWKKADPAAYNAGKKVASDITKALHAETGIPQKALEASLGLFKSTPELLNNSKLRKTATFFIERDNDDWARIAWEYISGGDVGAFVANSTSENITDILKQMTDNNVFKYLDDLKITDPKELDVLNEVALKVKMFNEERLRTDIARGVKFGEGSENKILEDKVESYLKHVYEGDDLDMILTKSAISSTEAANTAINTRLGSANRRKFQSLAMQKSINPNLKAVDDVIASVALRENESLRVELNKRLYQSIQESVDGVGVNKVGKIDGMDALFATSEQTASPAMRRIDIGIDSEGRRVSLWAVPDMVNQINRVSSTFSTNAGAKQVLEWYDNITNVIKTLQTSANPAFLARNAIGETMMNWFAGVDIKSHRQAANILKEINMVQDVVRVGDGIFYKGAPMYRFITRDGAEGIEYIPKLTRDSLGDKVTWADATFRPLSSVTDVASLTKDINKEYGIKLYKIGEYELSGHDLMTIFRDKGLGWSGITKGNLIKNTEASIKAEIRGAAGNIAQQGMKALQDSGDYVETWTRFSHFLDRLKKGMSIDDAVSDVRMYHVDYRNLTNVERNTFRRIMPYYTYMRKNLPIQMNNLLSSYNKVGMITHMVDSSYQALERDNGGQPLVVDDYLREGMALPIDVDENGNITYLNWNLPINDLARLKYNFKDFFEANVLDMVSPILRSGVELNTNTNLRFGTQIQKFEGETTPLIPGVERSPQIGRYTDYMIQQMGVINTGRQTAGHILNALQGKEQDPLRPINPLAYIGLQSFLPTRNQQNTANNQAYDYRDQLQDYIKKLKAKGHYVPDTSEIGKPRKSFFSKYTP